MSIKSTFLCLLLTVFTLGAYAQKKSVYWVNKKNVSAKNGYISRFAEGIQWNSGATSGYRLLKEKDGSVEAIVQKAKQKKILGLAKIGKVTNWEIVAYGIAIDKGKYEVVEDGNSVFKTEQKAKKGDLISIHKKGTQISYALNGETIYTSEKKVTIDLRVQVAFYIAGVGYYKVKTTGFQGTSSTKSKTSTTAGPVLMKVGYGLHGSEIEISGINTNTLAAINKVADKEAKVIEVSMDKMTQKDFDLLCKNLPWIKKLAIKVAKNGKTTNLNAIKQLTDLEHIFFDGSYGAPPLDNPIDLALITTLKKLKEISIYQCKNFTNYDALGSVLSLKTLDLGNADKAELSFLSSLKGLEKLSLSEGSGSFTDISILGTLTSLRFLDIASDREIQDLSPLYTLKALEEIKISTTCPDNEIQKLREALPNLRGVIKL